MKLLIRIFILILPLTISWGSLATTIKVKQDGTGNYTIIQYAIDASSDGDTILVWPGRYYENVDYKGKNITLASLALTTGDETYKYTTIIDGNHNGSCVKVMSGETDAIIFGFSLQHGSGTNFGHPYLHRGGGIIITYSSLTVKLCVISNNNTDGRGGGIFCNFYSDLFISQTSIFNNHSYHAGGGIHFGYESTMEFDSINLCSIYSNYASRGCDFEKSNNDPLLIHLDTCTVTQPDTYYISSIDQHGYQVYDITFNIQNHVIMPKDDDLYVDPIIGDNNNTGLSPEEPLQTIAFAYSSILVDSLDKNTIYLANGLYSDSANHEKFPLNIRPYINVVGESRNNTILDGMFLSRIIKGNNEVSDYSFNKMTMKRGGYVHNNEDYGPAGFAMLYIRNDNIVLDSILFTNGHGYSGYGQLSIQASNNVHVKNCQFSDNVGAYALRTGSDTGDTITISNCIFNDNKPDNQQPNVWGGALGLIGYNTATIVQGCLFTGNNYYNVGVQDSYSAYNAYFINCTFVSNTHDGNEVSIGSNDASTFLYNCISYDEGSKPLSLTWNEATDTVSLEIYNSLIEGAEESISIMPGITKLLYDETNIDTDPLFYGGAEFPYNLGDYSPCIDVGTMELPDFIELPSTDLAGNPRIWNGNIDMGAYEWNPTVGIGEFEPNLLNKENLLKAAPNPFSFDTYITAHFRNQGNITVEVYNQMGQRVKVLMNNNGVLGTSEILWNGNDDYNKPLPSGIYYVVINISGQKLGTLKVVKL